MTASSDEPRTKPASPPTNTKPRRRWLRFSLRTLFVVLTATCLWLGWQLHVAKERKVVLAWINDKDGAIRTWDVPTKTKQWMARAPQPWIDKYQQISMLRLRWLNDKPAYYINLVDSDVTWEEVQRVRRLFPEAFVVPERPPKTK